MISSMKIRKIVTYTAFYAAAFGAGMAKGMLKDKTDISGVNCFLTYAMYTIPVIGGIGGFCNEVGKEEYMNTKGDIASALETTIRADVGGAKKAGVGLITTVLAESAGYVIGSIIEKAS